MPPRKKRNARKSAPFTKIYATWPRLLHEAKVSGVEWAVLVALAQHPQRNGLYSRPVADYGAAQDGIATATGCSPAQVRKALEALTKKTFTATDGTQTPILTRKVSAHRGKCAVFKCNLPMWQDHETSDHDDTKKSVTNSVPKNEKKGTQSGASCVPNQVPHLELGKGGQDHPPLPWFR
jgi:hypothetical protein